MSSSAKRPQKWRTLGRVLCTCDDLVYCVFPGWGRYMAVGIPLDIFGEEPEPNFRFLVRCRLDLEQLHHKDFDFSDWEFNLNQDPSELLVKTNE